MAAASPRYVVDTKGKKKAILLDIKEYSRLLDRLEDLEDALELGAGSKGRWRLPGLPEDQSLTGT